MELDAERYSLPPKRHDEIFKWDIAPDVFADAKTAAQPKAIVFGGQPGAGKSAAVDDAISEFAGKGGCAQIIGDDLRSYHPRYESLLTQDDKTAAFFTDRDTGRWVEKSIEYAIKHRLNVVIEGTMRDSDKVVSTLKALRDAGYQVEARALAVNSKLSQQGILQRYEAQKKDRGTGRMTTAQAHDAAYRGLPSTLDRIERDKLADRVSVYRRGGEQIYRNELRGGDWAHKPPRAAAVLEAERSRPFTLAEHREYISNFEQLQRQQGQPGRNATSGERAVVADALASARRDFEAVKGQVLHVEAIEQAARHRDELAGDQRFAAHTPDELARAAYGRALYELSTPLDGRPVDLARFDAIVANRETARQLPDMPHPDTAERVDHAGQPKDPARDDDLSL